MKGVRDAHLKKQSTERNIIRSRNRATDRIKNRGTVQNEGGAWCEDIETSTSLGTLVTSRADNNESIEASVSRESELDYSSINSAIDPNYDVSSSDKYSLDDHDND